MIRPVRRLFLIILLAAIASATAPASALTRVGAVRSVANGSLVTVDDRGHLFARAADAGARETFRLIDRREPHVVFQLLDDGAFVALAEPNGDNLVAREPAGWLLLSEEAGPAGVSSFREVGGERWLSVDPAGGRVGLVRRDRPGAAERFVLEESPWRPEFTHPQAPHPGALHLPLRPRLGSTPLLAILVDYPDFPIDDHAHPGDGSEEAYPPEFFRRILFGERPSARTYFEESSYGAFTVSDGGVIGWLRDPRPFGELAVPAIALYDAADLGDGPSLAETRLYNSNARTWRVAAGDVAGGNGDEILAAVVDGQDRSTFFVIDPRIDGGSLELGPSARLSSRRFAGGRDPLVTAGQFDADAREELVLVRQEDDVFSVEILADYLDDDALVQIELQGRADAVSAFDPTGGGSDLLALASRSADQLAITVYGLVRFPDGRTLPARRARLALQGRNASLAPLDLTGDGTGEHLALAIEDLFGGVEIRVYRFDDGRLVEDPAVAPLRPGGARPMIASGQLDADPGDEILLAVANGGQTELLKLDPQPVGVGWELVQLGAIGHRRSEASVAALAAGGGGPDRILLSGRVSPAAGSYRAEDEIRKARGNAVTLADEEVDFSSFDVNDDGLVDPSELVIVVVYSQEKHSVFRGGFYRTIDAPPGRLYDGVRLADDPEAERFSSALEVYLHAPLRTILHELGHALLRHGDLYETQDSNDGVAGDLSLMDRGDTLLDPWIKIHAGWLDPILVTRPRWYHLRSAGTAPEVLLLHQPERGREQYFLIENRFRGTSYDAGFPEGAPDIANPTARADTRIRPLRGQGLAVWRVDERDFTSPRAAIRLLSANGAGPIDSQNALWDGCEPARDYDLTSHSAPMAARWADGSASTIEMLEVGPAGERVLVWVNDLAAIALDSMPLNDSEEPCGP